MMYDRAEWHHHGEYYPKDLPPEQAYVHMGLFLGWAVERELTSAEFAEQWKDDLDLFREHRITGPQLFRRCGGALEAGMLTAEGRQFAGYYLALPPVRFWEDYEEVLATDLPSIYHVTDNAANYEQLRDRVDQRFRDWWALLPAHRRRISLFLELLQEFQLGETELADVTRKRGTPSDHFDQQNATFILYDEVDATSIGEFDKLELTFLDDVLMAIMYLEPTGGMTQTGMRAELGDPDFTEDRADGAEYNAHVDVYVLDPEADSLLCLAIHADPARRVRCVSLTMRSVDESEVEESPEDGS